ncbi:uncharacterized protein F4822DRAFT_393067 [Hypoxylon trugodes]|uniref:uncharacterized protein n=1 Tax=Hypoxylon trugodes TaxID=326681 RepID=UPI0021997E6F|nr:uncharacterized protein F4822DRAFT_393067 [Hypoxylon trugodes]KAI1393096.1 hypothetical protein F4822DRAFT_393067 [Hypoxylon trugodes]
MICFLPLYQPACDIPVDLINPSLRNDQLLPEPMEGVIATSASPLSPTSQNMPVTIAT